MAAITKFSFDTTFDTAEEFVVPEAEETLPPEPTYDEADLTAARDQGYAAGFQAASEEARASIETATAGALEEITRQLTAMETVLTSGLHQAERSAIGLAGAIARKMVDKTIQDNAQASIEAIISDVLGQVLDEPRVVIRVSDQILDPLKQRLSSVTQKSGFPGSVILLAEPGIENPDCKIEWADGGADYVYEKLWTEIDEIVERHTLAIGAEDGGPEQDTPAGDAPEPEHVISEEQSNG